MTSKKPPDGLSEDGSTSIYLYTMELAIRENSLYTVLNQTFHLDNREKLQSFCMYLKWFFTIKLPTTKYRTI
ncbi:unnamed protein product [Rotaria sordida]|uniref:Uncharacterized protein n=1 Tax=Rotaria sordida TaxID=392033 RepID=A0A814A1Y5_9BILA|nr:unnamed protein product [Rotaria sordida]CAF0953076.1 unnamed protein product [Rotaria sordida]